MKTQDWRDAWTRENDKGNGYSVGGPEPDSGQEPYEAALAEGLTVIDRDDTWNVLAVRPDGTLVAICDAHGPWACDVGTVEEWGLDASDVKAMVENVANEYKWRGLGGRR